MRPGLCFATISAVEQDAHLFNIEAVLGEEPVRCVPHAKFLRLVQEQLAPLKDVPAHGNRTLHLHPVVVALVFSFYDPLIRSLRPIEAYTTEKTNPRETPAVAKPDGEPSLQRMARSTTSDSLKAFDSRLLVDVIRNLQRQVPQLRKVDSNLQNVLKEIVAADGTYLSIFSDTAWALVHTKKIGRAHV